MYVGAVGSDGKTTLVDTLTRDHRTTILQVEDPGAGSAATQVGFATMWKVGFSHFREGADHLLFLSIVMLGAARRRTGWVRTARSSPLLP